MKYESKEADSSFHSLKIEIFVRLHGEFEMKENFEVLLDAFKGSPDEGNFNESEFNSFDL